MDNTIILGHCLRHAYALYELVKDGKVANDWLIDTKRIVKDLGDDVTIPLEAVYNIETWTEDERKILLNLAVNRIPPEQNVRQYLKDPEQAESFCHYIYFYCRNRALEQHQAISSLIEFFEEDQIYYPRPFLSPIGGWMLFFINQGEAEFMYEGESYPIKEGELLLVPENIKFSINQKTNCDHCAVYVNVFYSSERWVQFLEIDQLDEQLFLGTTHASDIIKSTFRETMKNIIEISHSELEYKNELHLNMLEKILLLYKEARSEIANKDLDNRILKACKFIKENFANNFSVEDVAEASNTSASTLTTLFRNRLRTNIIKYRDKIRVLTAKKLLIETKDPIKTIAYQVGYEDPLFFSRRFKQITGRSPAHTRKKIL